MALVVWARRQLAVAEPAPLPRWQRMRRGRGLDRLRRRGDLARAASSGLAATALAGFIAWYGAGHAQAGEAWLAGVSWQQVPRQAALRLIDLLPGEWLAQPGSAAQTVRPASISAATSDVQPRAPAVQPADRSPNAAANLDDYLREEPYSPAAVATAALPPADGAVPENTDGAPAIPEVPAPTAP